MTADDLRTRLRCEVLGDEPRFAMTSDPAIRAGTRRLRWRRTATAFGAVALVACALVLGSQLLPVPGPSGAELPAVTQKALDDFDPQTFPATFDQEVRAALGDALPTTVTGRIEPTFDGYLRLRPKDYAYTDSWTGWYDLSPTDRLIVILNRDAASNEVSARRSCELRLADGQMARCTVRTLDNGRVATVAVFKVHGAPSGFAQSRPGARGISWFARQVSRIDPDDFGVTAREYVLARSLAEADRLWSADVDQLAAIATSPRLVYQIPPPPESGCQPTFYPPEDGDGFTRVVC